MAYGLSPQRPAVTMPTVPTYKMPTGNTNPAIPQAQRSQFYTDNPWSDPYTGFNADVAGKSNTLFGRAMATDPTRAGGILSDPSHFTSAFNLNYPDVNNPNTIASLGKWSSILGGGAENAVQAMLPQLAGAGITASRGGYAPVGQGDPTAALQQQAIKTVAGDYTGRIGQGMEWLKNLAAFNQGNASNYVSAISKIFGDMLSGSQSFSGQNLQGLTASDASKTKYREDAASANAQDVADYNHWNEGDAQRNWDIKKRNQGWADEQTARDRAEANRQGFLQTTGQLGKPSPSSGNEMDPAQQALMEYYGTQVGAWGKPNWKAFELSGGGGARAASPTGSPSGSSAKSGYFPNYNDSQGAIWGAG